MNEQAIFHALSRARKGLRDCLGELEAANQREPVVGAPFSEVEAAFEALGDLNTLANKVPEGAKARLKEGLEELLRLNALLSNAIDQDRERVIGLLHQSRQGQKNMDAIADAGGGESTCDVSA